MPKVLITGGTGFVGTWMVKQAPPDMEITAIGTAGYNLWYWHKVKWDYIIHLAHIPPAKVLQCALENQARVLYASSGIVCQAVDSQYRREKIQWENDCYYSGVNVVVARLFTFYGEKLDNDKAVTRWTKAIKENKPIEIWGDGNTVRSYMHGAIMADWLWSILLRGKSGYAYEVGSDEPITLLQKAQDMVKEAGSHVEIIIKNGKDLVPFYLPTQTEKTKSLLTE
jgi:nucleoside-diphosphate-sugar epimerase